MRPNTVQEELFILYQRLGGTTTGMTALTKTSQEWLALINQQVSGGLSFSGQIINSSAFFVETSAPTFRKNSAGANIGALVDGDRWFNPSTGILGSRFGVYWLTTEIMCFSRHFSNTSTSQANFAVGTSQSDLQTFVTRARFDITSAGWTASGTDFWRLEFTASSDTGAAFNSGGIYAYNISGLTSLTISQALPNFQTWTYYNFRTNLIKVGAPSNVTGIITVFARGILT